MTTANNQQKQNGNFQISNKNHDDISVISESAKDVFKGKVLVDRLLVYYNKFEGSRDRAIRYAQKLLDLGHIESLTNSVMFEDTAHVYRWSNVEQVIDEVKSKMDGSRQSVMPAVRRQSRSSKMGENQESGRAVLKISIETDNCQAAEIQAHIHSSPRSPPIAKTRTKSVDHKTVTAVEEDSFFERRITKTLSYVNEPNEDIENKKKTPFITDVSSPPDNRSSESWLRRKENNSDLNANSHLSNANNKEFMVTDKNILVIDESNVKNNETTSDKENSSKLAPEYFNSTLSPRKKPFRGKSSPTSAKKWTSSISSGRASLLQHKSATEPTIVKDRAPGTDVSRQPQVKPTHHTEATPDNQQNSSIRTYENNCYIENSTSKSQKSATCEADDNLSQRDLKNEIHTNSDVKIAPPTHIASTQTSEKSILEASQLFRCDKSRNTAAKRSPSPAPRTFKRSENSTNEIESDYNKRQMERQNAKTKELQRVNSEQSQKKTRFSSEVSDASVISDTKLTNIIQREESEAISDREMSLHSTGNVDNTIDNYREESSRNIIHIPHSPPPPSPQQPLSDSPPKSSLKSLFWTKLSAELEQKHHKVFWDELEESMMTVDEKEFEKLFSKPIMKPQTPQLKRGKSSEGGSLKVLGLERSRQVSIRANSVRLAIDEIHDAIINMDDTKLDIDSLQALYDVRPSPEELDQIADALKSCPNAILDKPEQFVLMLAMIPSLDERLRCWIFAKKFPDKIVDVQEQLLAINEACNQIMQSTTLKKVLELVLLLGNRMNSGTQRGNAYGYNLDILPKLKDVKSQNGETNLLQYTVKTLRDHMKLEGLIEDTQLATPRANDSVGLPDTDVLSRSTSVSLSDLGDELEEMASELKECKDYLLPVIIRSSTIPAESESFQVNMGEFLEKAEEKLRVHAQLYQDALLTAEDFQKYYIPTSDSEQKETLISMLRFISQFCADFKAQWFETQREEIKEEFYKIQKYKQKRQAAIQIRNTPSALKERFMSRRNTNISAENGHSTPGYKLYAKQSKAQTNGINGQSTRDSQGIRKRNYKFQVPCDRYCDSPSDDHFFNGYALAGEQERASSNGSFSERANENALKIERKLQELSLKRS